MKKGKSQILQTMRGSSKYFVSVVEKENDSGIFFNQRILFLASGSHIGYLSEVKMQEEAEKINFQKPKTTIQIKNIKSIVINEKQLSIKFFLIDGDKKSERTWLLRMETKELVKMWYDLLQREKITLSSNLTSKRMSESSEIKPSPSKLELSEKKNFQIVKNIQLSQPGQRPKEVKQTREFKEIGIGVSPKHVQQQSNNQNLLMNSPLKKVSPQQKLNTIMKQSQNENGKEKRQTTPKVNSSNNNQNYFPAKKLESPREQVRKPETMKPSSPKKELKKQQSVRQIRQTPKQAHNRQVQRQQAPKQIQRPLQQSKVSQLKSPKSNINPSSSLVNTKYLNSQPKQPLKETQPQREPQLSNTQRLQQMNTSKQSSRSRHYLQRTHQLIKGYEEQEQSNRTEPKIYVFPSRQAQSRQQQSKISQTDRSNWGQLPWTYKYIKYGHLAFKQFESFTQQLMREIITDLSKQGKKYKPKLIKNNIYYYDIKDIQVKLAFISLEEVQSSPQANQTQRVCNKRAIKKLQNQFNNFKAIYEYCEGLKLRVALSSLCEYNTFVGLFKVTSKHLSKNVRLKQIQPQLASLQKLSKIHINFTQQLDNIIIQLDEGYYDGLKTNDQEDQKISFNVYMIQEVEAFLLPDLISQEPDLLLRKELVDNYRTNSTPIQRHQFFSHNPRQNQAYTQELQTFSKNILIAISDVIIQMDSFQVYFLNSKDFSHYLHSKGINIRYLGHLYQNLRTVFQKRFVMTEMAARSCKTLFRKTIQDVMIGESLQLHSKICDFLNCVLGSTYETAAIWKVLSTHSRVYFGFQLNFDQIDRGHFIISLIEHCRLDVVWERIRPEEAFKSNIYFTQNNLNGLRTVSKSYKPVHSRDYANAMRIIQGQQIYSKFQELVNILQLKHESIPAHLQSLSNPITKYISLFISPIKAQSQYPHLHLYDISDTSCPSRIRFDLLLMQIKWFLKLKHRDQYIKICDYFIRLATKYYGEFHPIFCQLYELFSAYHLNNSEYQDAITFAKSSLVNILKICGTNHEKTSQFYFNLGLCYIKCSKSDEAMAHIKKALLILQNNNKVETTPYAVMQLKLALLYLNQNQVELSVRCARNSLGIFDAKAREVQGGFEDQIVECLQVLNRCYQLLHLGQQGKQVLEECQIRLGTVRKPENLEKILKIYLSPILSGLSPEKASNYLDIISLLNYESNEETYGLAYKFLRERMREGSFLPNLYVYLKNLQEIQERIRDSRILQDWTNFSQVYQRETVKDFTSLSVELVTFLGEGYLCGCLRQAL